MPDEEGAGHFSWRWLQLVHNSYARSPSSLSVMASEEQPPCVEGSCDVGCVEVLKLTLAPCAMLRGDVRFGHSMVAALW